MNWYTHLYVLYHNCFSFISQLESIMHKPAFVELTGCTTIMCLLGYYTATECYRREKMQMLFHTNECYLFMKSQT